MSLKLFIITGDYSGDMHAANVVRELRERQPDIQVKAVGGERLRALGVELVSDQSRLGKIGLGSLLSAPEHYFLGRKVLAFLEKYQPDAVLLIDYGMFNLWMAQQLKKGGIRVFYFVPPQVWATRQGRIRKIKAFVDHVFCIFPFEEDLYRSHGVPVTYVGHPLVGQLPPPAERQAFCRDNGLDADKPIIGIFPGSRKMELDFLLQPMIGAVSMLHEKRPDAQFVLAKAGSLNTEFFNRRLSEARALDGENGPPISKNCPPITVLEGRNHAILSVCDAVMLASGTVTLEAALYKTPLVLMYRLQPFAYWVVTRFMYKHPSIGLPNILTDMHDPIVPELLQGNITPKNITNALLPLLDPDSPEARKARAGYEEIACKLKGNAPANVAEGILRLLGALPVKEFESIAKV